MFKVFLPVLFLVSAATVLGTTSPGVSSCGSDTLASYVGSYPPPSVGCSIGILDYSNFSYSAISNAPAASDIEVAPNGQGFALPRWVDRPLPRWGTWLSSQSTTTSSLIRLR